MKKRDQVPLRRIFIFTILFLTACGAPRFDIDSALGRRAIKDKVNLLLTEEKCEEAIELITGLYESKYSDNETRILYAASHSCYATINFFQLISDLAENSDDLQGAAMFELFSVLFEPASGDTYTHLDSRLQSAYNASDALMAVMADGQTVPEYYGINNNSYNPGSLLYYQRTDDSNLSMVFVSMATMGLTQQRYGSPSTDGQQTVQLPFLFKADNDSASATEEAACGYASSMLNMVDGIDGVVDALDESTAATFSNITSTLKNGIGGVAALSLSSSCNYGCQGRNVLDTANVDIVDCGAGAGLGSGDCNPCPSGSATCVQCPVELRTRKGCQSEVKAGCSAAGLIRLMDTAWTDD